MDQPRRIYFVLYDGFELLDMSGPACVFTSANSLTKRALYHVEALSEKGGLVTSGAGFQIHTRGIGEVEPGPEDTLLMTGSDNPALVTRPLPAGLRVWWRQATRQAGRYGSVCTGTVPLAASRLLEGRHVATHWEATDYLRRTYSTLRVEPDRLYVVDGALWTSAGATSAIDMALAMLERDHGTALMGKVARRLVVYAHRPGNQSQFSALLAAQTAGQGRFAPLLDWVQSRLAEPLTLEMMAEQAGMSERSFRRHFTKAVGMAPAKFVEALRLDRARALLEAGGSIKRAAADVGFRSEAGFRAAFQLRFGISPSLHRRMNGHPRAA